MSQRRGRGSQLDRQNSQVETRSSQDIAVESTVPPTVLYSPQDIYTGSPHKQKAITSPAKASSLRNTPFHEPFLANTASLSSLPILPPLPSPSALNNDEIMIPSPNPNMRMLDDDPNETQLLSASAKSRSSVASGKSDSDGIVLRGNNSSISHNDELDKEVVKERLFPQSNPNWRDDVASDSSSQVTSPSEGKLKRKAKKLTGKLEKDDDIEEKKEKKSPEVAITGAKDAISNSEDDFQLAVPEVPKSKLQMKTLKVVQMGSPSKIFRTPDKPSRLEKILAERATSVTPTKKTDKRKSLSPQESSKEIISISSFDDQAQKKKSIKELLRAEPSRSPFESDKRKRPVKQILSKNQKKLSDEEDSSVEDNYKETTKPKRKSRPSESIGHTTPKKRKRAEISESEISDSISSYSSRPSKVRKVDEKSSEEEQSEPIVEEELEEDYVVSKPSSQRREPKSNEPLDIDTVLNFDFSKYLTEEDCWFLYEAPVGEIVDRTEERGRYFQGCSFILTGLAMRSNASIAPLIDTLAKIVKSLGGSVVESVPSKLKLEELHVQGFGEDDEDEEQIVLRPNCFLVAPTHLRTAKYLQALSLGVPCVHYSWILHCYSLNTYVDPNNFLLFAGKSLDDKMYRQSDKLFEDFPKSDFSLLMHNDETNDSYRVEVVGEPDFKKSIDPIVRSTGAKLVDRLLGPFNKQTNLDFLISDPTPDKIVVRAARKRGLPLISKEWLIQSIIRNQIIDHEEDERYVINV